MALDILFTKCGSPKTLVCDNGPQFGPKQFEDCVGCRLNRIVHLTVLTFYPATTGEVELMHLSLQYMDAAFCVR